MAMYYFIYKTTNLINGKYYIGQHHTEDLNDGYLGSRKSFYSSYQEISVKKTLIERFWNLQIVQKS